MTNKRKEKIKQNNTHNKTNTDNIQTQNNANGYNSTSQVTAIAATGSATSGNTYGNIGYSPASSAEASIFGSGWMYLAGVQNDTYNVSALGRLTAITATSTGTEFISVKSSLYGATVKGIRFFGAANFEVGSTFYIYGILAA